MFLPYETREQRIDLQQVNESPSDKNREIVGEKSLSTSQMGPFLRPSCLLALRCQGLLCYLFQIYILLGLSNSSVGKESAIQLVFKSVIFKIFWLCSEACGDLSSTNKKD